MRNWVPLNVYEFPGVLFNITWPRGDKVERAKTFILAILMTPKLAEK